MQRTNLSLEGRSFATVAVAHKSNNAYGNSLDSKYEGGAVFGSWSNAMGRPVVRSPIASIEEEATPRAIGTDTNQEDGDECLQVRQSSIVNSIIHLTGRKDVRYGLVVY